MGSKVLILKVCSLVSIITMKFTLYLTVLFVFLQVSSLVHAKTSFNLTPEAHSLVKREAANRGYHHHGGYYRPPPSRPQGINIGGILTNPFFLAAKGAFIGTLLANKI